MVIKVSLAPTRRVFGLLKCPSGVQTQISRRFKNKGTFLQVSNMRVKSSLVLVVVPSDHKLLVYRLTM